MRYVCFPETSNVDRNERNQPNTGPGTPGQCFTVRFEFLSWKMEIKLTSKMKLWRNFLERYKVRGNACHSTLFTRKDNQGRLNGSAVAVAWCGIYSHETIVHIFLPRSVWVSFLFYKWSQFLECQFCDTNCCHSWIIFSTSIILGRNTCVIYVKVVN